VAVGLSLVIDELMRIFALLLSLLLAACTEGGADRKPSGSSRPSPDQPFALDLSRLDRSVPLFPANDMDRDPQKRAYFGDLHVHTKWSMDAFIFGGTVTPDEAYLYAQGEALAHPAGFTMQLREPLDFYAVTDHALFLGLSAAAADREHPFSSYPAAEPLHDLNRDGNRTLLSIPGRLGLFSKFVPGVLDGLRDESIPQDDVAAIGKSAWLDIVTAADAHYQPGSFTTFVAYEYTSGGGDGGSLHRNVIFRDSVGLPAEPFSRFHSRDPEGLWDWLDGLRADGVEALAIPHNSNASDGQMFSLVDWAGDPFDSDYIAKRIRNEPLFEISQVKGTSETHPSLSDTDEWASFEIKPFIGSSFEISEPKGSYVRQALRDGLVMADQDLGNPYALGFVAASDSHTGATTDNEADFYSKIGLLDATPELRGSVPLPWWQSLALGWILPKRVVELEGQTYARTPTTTFGASGLAGVWAEENTREAIYSAFRRKETFATSGPRLRVRLYAGYGLGPDVLEDPARCATECPSAVPMGGEFETRPGEAPQFLAWAVRDPLSAPLQRLQIVKGWSHNGISGEEVHDVACAVGVPDPETHRCPKVAAPVDLGDCSYTERPGAGELRALWSDPDFNAEERAFYYVRVLENPTCRWSTWDALRAGLPPRSDLPVTVQERAWSSPVWRLPLS